MAALVDLQERWNEILKHTDPRSEGYLLMESPLPAALICLLYVLIVLVGSTLMKDRPAFNLRKTLIVYNFAMVLLSGYVFAEFLLSGWLTGYSLGCQPVDYSWSPKALRMVRACWLFFFSKFIELLDTVFFLMRKNFRQVTFLHVFHHGIMPVSWWFGVKFVPGGFGTFHAMLNSLIHFLMYTYYGLAAMGPQYQKYLWWKRYMTSMQIAQFILVTIHTAQLLFMECDYPQIFVYWVGLYAIIFLMLFGNFYVQAYLSPKDAANGDLKRR